MGKINNLQVLKKDIKGFKVNGLENFSEGELNIYVANHNSIMDIFYLPMAIPEEVVSLISARLLYKKVGDRQEIINKYLNALPIEAHGGKHYAFMGLNSGANMIYYGNSICIFPEGAYVDEDKIYRGRTGAARILFTSLSRGIKVNFIPVSINIKNTINDLDDYHNVSDNVEVTILDKVDYTKLYERYLLSKSYDEKNAVLHELTDTAMMAIAESLNKEYINEYITLKPKGNVIYSDGTTLDVEEAQKVKHLIRYSTDLRIQENFVRNSIVR